MDQGPADARDLSKPLCLNYVRVIIEININPLSLHGRLLSIFYLACGWQGEWIVWSVFAKEEREASMFRLAWVSEIKSERCQGSWHGGCGFSQQAPGKETNSFHNKIFSGHFGFIVGNISVPSKSDRLNCEVHVGKCVLWLSPRMLGEELPGGKLRPNCTLICVLESFPSINV